MQCLRSLKHSVVSIRSNWSTPFVSHTYTLFLFLFVSRDIPRIPDSTHAQLESSESCQTLSHQVYVLHLVSLCLSSSLHLLVFLPSYLLPSFLSYFISPHYLNRHQRLNNMIVSCQVRVLLSPRRWIVRPSLSRRPWVPACWGTPPSTCQDSSQWVTLPWHTNHMWNSVDCIVRMSC